MSELLRCISSGGPTSQPLDNGLRTARLALEVLKQINST